MTLDKLKRIIGATRLNGEIEVTEFENGKVQLTLKKRGGRIFKTLVCANVADAYKVLEGMSIMYEYTQVLMRGD